MTGFRKFLLHGSLIDLAVAVVVGVAFSQVVQALIKDLITPLIAALGGKPNFRAWSSRSTRAISTTATSSMSPSTF